MSIRAGVLLVLCSVATAAQLGCDPGDRTLRWAFTCGDPVCCFGHVPSPHPPCTTEQQGDVCYEEDAICDPVDDGNVYLTCQVEGWSPEPCPVSVRSAKKDIHYLASDELDALRRELMAVPLASWRYRGDDAGREPRLGFIIDDVIPSPAVQSDGEHVDLYGFASLTAAAVQAQEHELRALRVEVGRLRAELEVLRAAQQGP